MILLFLAQYQLPSAAFVWGVGFIITVILFGGGIFIAGRVLRSNVADELKRELATASQPAPVAVQQPLHVKAAVEFVTKDDHERRIGEIKDELKQLDHERRTSVAKIHDKIEENTKVTASLGGKLEIMNQNFHQLNTSLTTFLQNHAKK